MSGTFPLYDNLFREVEDNDLTKTERDDFLKLVKKIDTDGSELFYAVVKCYQLNNGSSTDFINTPYNSKMVKGALKFELDDIPGKLKRMLYVFLKKHLQKMKEEGIRLK